jgi:hypothetical protein
MIRPLPEQVEQFSRLMHTQVHVYMKAAVEECRDILEHTQDVEKYRVVQGELKSLRTLLTLIETGKQA